jgi:hypothetical protein
MKKSRGFVVLLLLFALLAYANLREVQAMQPAVYCTDVAGCKGEAFCAVASAIEGCDIACKDGVTLHCDPK